MGSRYESKRGEVKNVNEERDRISSAKELLEKERSMISSLDGVRGNIDDDTAAAVFSVENALMQESNRLEEESRENDAERERVDQEIDQEISKLNSGMEKLKSLDSYRFGKKANEQGKSEFRKQIDKFKALKAELLNASESGDSGAVSSVISENAGLIESMNDNASDYSGDLSIEHPVNNASVPLQTEHRPLASSHEEAVNTVISDVKAGSGRDITAEQAENYIQSVQIFSRDDWTGAQNDFRRIRNAYNNPAASREDVELMQTLDEYINSVPKWQGQVYRGINIDEATARSILSQPNVDMLGAASWSSEMGVAERFASGSRPVRMVFILPENKSGASITHIAAYDGMESEITAPSGIVYNIDRYERVNVGGREFYHVFLHE